MRVEPDGQQQQQQPHVVIVGGGFGGLYAARALAKRPVRLTLVDRENYHLFQPLLYQVATAALSPGDIAEPLRAILRQHRNVEVLLGDVTSVDLAARRVVLERGGELGYDYLVLATGVTHSYFGHAAWEPLAPGLKTLEDALEIRRRILFAFEAAEREPDPERRRAWLTFVVVGGGPTGVELAGQIAELSRRVLPKDFKTIDSASARVLLFDGGREILATFGDRLSAIAATELEGQGVEIHTGSIVTDVDRTGVEVKGQ